MRINKTILRLMAVALFGAAILTGLNKSVDAYPGKGGRAERVTVDFGDTMIPYAVSISSEATAKIYTKQAGRVDRILVICNGQAFNLHIGTSSTVAASAASMLIPENSCETIPTPAQDLWGIYEAGATTLNVNGYKQLDSRD